MKRWQSHLLTGAIGAGLGAVSVLAAVARVRGLTWSEFFDWLAFWVGYWTAIIVIIGFIPGILVLRHVIRKREREAQQGGRRADAARP